MKNKKRTARKTFYYCIYLRKSTEEEDSRSIGNQKSVFDGVIEKIIAEDPYNDYINVGTFKDEDYTGTDSDRPDFRKVLKLMGQGEINMILVTDLSRLSRNIAESINYVQSYFVMMDIRFVSYQLPDLDSYLNPEKVYSLEIPMQSMMNENHCAETSMKVRRTQNRLREEGKFIGSFAPYGWIKDPNDKHKLIIDEEACEVMQLMKELLFQYNSGCVIAKQLNEKGILSPAGYKKEKGYKHNSINKNITGQFLCSGVMVRKLLGRPENMGTLIQGRQRVKSYKVHKRIKVPEEEWFVTPNGLPAIFTEEEQKKINKLLAMNFRELDKKKKKLYMTQPMTDEGGKKKEPYLFSGFVRCPDCGRALNRKSLSKKEYAYYICGSYKNYGTCTKHSIREDELAEIVYTAIKQQIDIAVEMDVLIKEIQEAPIIKKKTFDYQEQKEKQKKELYRIAHYKKDLYQDFKDELISKKEYLNLKKEYSEQEEHIQSVIDSLENELANTKHVVEQKDMYLEKFIQYKGFDKLNRDILLDLIKQIYVYENKDVKIEFTFEDEYKNLIEFMEEGKKLVQNQ